MADYYNPTVVQQTIPNADMTALERLLLARIFESEEDGDGLYFFSENGPNDQFDMAVDELRAALAKSTGIPSRAADYMAERLKEVADGDSEVEIDFSATSWEFILQDIVRRSSTLDHVTVVGSFTCSRMRADGWGGIAMLITADAVKGKSTNDILDDFLTEQEAPRGRSHVLLRLDETAVRIGVGEVIAADPALEGLRSNAVTDDDIHVACCDVAEHIDLSEQKGAAMFRAALAAIRAAERRRKPETIVPDKPDTDSDKR